MRRVRISYQDWDADLEIAEGFTDRMREQVEFWHGGEQRLRRLDGDVEKAYLEILAVELIILSIEFSVEGVIREFQNFKREGWYPIDGSYGVRLIAIDNWSFDENDFHYRVLPALPLVLGSDALPGPKEGSL